MPSWSRHLRHHRCQRSSPTSGPQSEVLSVAFCRWWRALMPSSWLPCSSSPPAAAGPPWEDSNSWSPPSPYTRCACEPQARIAMLSRGCSTLKSRHHTQAQTPHHDCFLFGVPRRSALSVHAMRGCLLAAAGGMGAKSWSEPAAAPCLPALKIGRQECSSQASHLGEGGYPVEVPSLAIQATTSVV